MPLTKVTYSMIDGAYINVLDYGATGDGVTDDTAAIQAAFDAAQGTYAERDKQIVYFPKGKYIISDTINVNIPTTDYLTPGILGEGPQSVQIIAASSMTASDPMLLVKGGSPGVFFQRFEGFHMEHKSVANGIAIELENIGGIQIDNVSFENVKIACRMTTNGGGFCEFNTLSNCRFGYDVLWWIEYYGDSSYHGSGLRQGCQGEVVDSQRCVKVTPVGGNPNVYNAPFNVNVWGNGTSTLIEHSSTVPARYYGAITLETAGQITLATTSSGAITFAGIVDWMGTNAPIVGSNVYLSVFNPSSGLIVGVNQQLNTYVQNDTDDFVYTKLEASGPGGTTVGTWVHPIASISFARAGTNSGAAAGEIFLGTSTNNQTNAPTNKVLIPNDAGIAIVDGSTAPSAKTGWAKIFVDSADGDLKIIFGDGTTKTIVTD